MHFHSSLQSGTWEQFKREKKKKKVRNGLQGDFFLLAFQIYQPTSVVRKKQPSFKTH